MHACSSANIKICAGSHVVSVDGEGDTRSHTAGKVSDWWPVGGSSANQRQRCPSGCLPPRAETPREASTCAGGSLSCSDAHSNRANTPPDHPSAGCSSRILPLEACWDVPFPGFPFSSAQIDSQIERGTQTGRAQRTAGPGEGQQTCTETKAICSTSDQTNKAW